ncbi:MAG: PAS domain-containing sensor histidine kinase [Chloroflexi bacterium]|nr:PAS domain-containing sensor histidine kinase [Chloroflexota bacterium]
MRGADRTLSKAHVGPFPPGAGRGTERRLGWLYPYRPRIRDWRFWAVQGLALLIAGTHTSLELLRVLGYSTSLSSDPAQVSLLSFVPVSLFFIPVVYAALNFGFAGAVATALWCTILTIPNIAMHQGMERVRELTQLGIVDAIAIFVGQRVEWEMRARRNAEAAGTALRASETKYRGLFESSPIAVVVLNPGGVVVEANPAAGALFDRDPDSLRGITVADLFGAESGERLLGRPADEGRRDAHIVFKSKDGTEVYLEPTLTRTSDNQGRPVVQVLLRNVTEQLQRQAGLRSYAAYVLRAQEEERKRIAHELHDDAVQRLILLCRQLDIAEDAPAPLPSPVTSGIREARRSAEEIVENLRGFARALRPPALDDLGLVPTIQRLLLDLSERTKTQVQFKVGGQERRLHPDTELVLFRIAQEALRNAERHAKAAHVTVSIAFAAHEARLEVLDNGIGFNLPLVVSDFAASGQLGLLGMQERAESLGGRLEVRSSPGKGTRVSASIPVADSAPQASLRRV